LRKMRYADDDVTGIPKKKARNAPRTKKNAVKGAA
jgi:hypothetical protein